VAVNNSGTMARSVFQLKVTLEGILPPVWRRLLVPGGYTLDRLHRAIQYGMGWRDCHLHSFEIAGVQYGEPEPDGDLVLADEQDHRLDSVAAKGDRFRYTYDFGDWWEHEIEVEDVMPADPGVRYPLCLLGERACPPEDIGGPEGYLEFLAALADPEHPEHEAMREWVGRAFDPESFDPGPVTTLMRRLA
jgi:Plasmid pRiA4b ORF-3-like protein